MNVSEVLENAVYAGKILLESGAEIYRVEETITRIALNCGMEEAEAFVLPTGIMVSVKKDGITNTKISRIRNRKINLHKIDLVNSLSREMDYELHDASVLKEKLKKIDQSETYSNYLIFLASGMGAMGHVFLFGGSVFDLSFSFVGGLIIFCVNYIAEKLKINFFISTLLAAFTVTLFQLLLTSLHRQVDMVIICSLMLLVPGLVMTNAIRDSVERDLGAALSRLLETVLIACAIALGVILAIWCVGVIK